MASEPRAQKPRTLEELESILLLPKAERFADHHTYLYRNAVLIEEDTMQPAEQVRLLLLKSRVLGDMEPEVFTEIDDTKSAGQKRTGHDAVVAALHVADHALQIAESLGDKASWGRVQLLRGQLLRRLPDFPNSAVAYRSSAALLEAAVREQGAVDPTLAHDLLDATIKLVSIEFMLGQLPAAQAWLDGAVALAQKINALGGAKAAVEVENIEWMRALLLRAARKPVAALLNATQAADLYLKKETSISSARILWLTTEIALDLADDAAARGNLRGIKVYQSTAQQYLEMTKERAISAMDPAGMLMAELSDARYQQLLNPASKVALNRVQRVLRRVEEERPFDWALRVDAFTVLGRALTVRKDTAGARRAFQMAVSIAEKNDSPGMALYAAEALKPPSAS